MQLSYILYIMYVAPWRGSKKILFFCFLLFFVLPSIFFCFFQYFSSSFYFFLLPSIFSASFIFFCFLQFFSSFYFFLLPSIFSCFFLFFSASSYFFLPLIDAISSLSQLPVDVGNMAVRISSPLCGGNYIR